MCSFDTMARYFWYQNCYLLLLHTFLFAFAQHIANPSSKKSLQLAFCVFFVCIIFHRRVFHPSSSLNGCTLWNSNHEIIKIQFLWCCLQCATVYMPLTLWRFDGSSLFNQIKVHDSVSGACVYWRKTNVMYLLANVASAYRNSLSTNGRCVCNATEWKIPSRLSMDFFPPVFFSLIAYNGLVYLKS